MQAQGDCMSQSSSPDKPEYFANGDFQDTVASIIASPRKRTINGISSEAAARLYEMSDTQREYYKHCFGKLMADIQGSIDFEGAVWGGENHVVGFFRKSQLDNYTLSRIWSMADVNADGWLDLAEFSVAMHLIVLHVKGGLDVPDCLPMHLRPALAVPRSPPPTPTWPSSLQGPRHFDESSSSSTNTVVHTHYPSSSSVSATVTSALPQSTSSTTVVGIGGPPQHSQSAEALQQTERTASDAPVANFSDVPPLLVDGRPTAIRTSQPIPSTATPTPQARTTAALLLSLKTPMGPPPQPPPRPSNRGHARSASLDLKVMSNVVPPPGSMIASARGPAPSLDSPDGAPPITSFRPMSTSLHATTSAGISVAVNHSTSTPAVPARPLRTPIPPPSSTAPSVNSTITVATVHAPPLHTQSAIAMTSTATVPSSYGHREERAPSVSMVSPPIAPRKKNSETQTEEPFTSRAEFESFIKEFVSKREDLLGGDPSFLDGIISDGKAPGEKWAVRCEVLRRQNAELERERARLAQVRIQLELRLQELDGTGTMGLPTSTTRPTNL